MMTARGGSVGVVAVHAVGLVLGLGAAGGPAAGRGAGRGDRQVALKGARTAQNRALRAEAERAVAGYLDEIEVRARRDSRDAVRRVQQHLREVFTEHAAELHTSTARNLELLQKSLREQEAQAQPQQLAKAAARDAARCSDLATRAGRLVDVAARAARPAPGSGRGGSGDAARARRRRPRAASPPASGRCCRTRWPPSRARPSRPGSRRWCAASTSRCGSRSPGGSRRASRRCSTRFVGERLAATDAGECTRVVTWYANGRGRAGVGATRTAAPPQQIRFHRVDGRTVLRARRAARRRPGPAGRRGAEQPAGPHDADRHARASARCRRRCRHAPTASALRRPRATTTTGEAAPVADAVLYLMRHLHSTDVGFLEAFHDAAARRGHPGQRDRRPVRADEVGAGRIDADRHRRAGRGRLPARPAGAGAGADGAAGRRAARRGRGRAAGARRGRPGRARRGRARRRRAAAVGAAVRGRGRAGSAIVPCRDAPRTAGRDGPVGGPAVGGAAARRASCTTRSGWPASCAGAAGWTRCATRCSPGSPSAATSSRPRPRSGPSSGCWPASPVPGAERLSAQVEAAVAGAHELVELRLLGDLRTGVVGAGRRRPHRRGRGAARGERRPTSARGCCCPRKRRTTPCARR